MGFYWKPEQAYMVEAFLRQRPEVGEMVHQSIPEVDEAASWQRYLLNGCPVYLCSGPSPLVGGLVTDLPFS